jgi:uncharacterized membrane protein
MPPIEGCVACETGECLEHGANLPPSSSDAGPGDLGRHPAHEDTVTREELHKFRKKVVKSVKRLNRAVKEARRERREAEAGVEPPTEPPAPPQRRMSDAAKLGLGVFRSCKRK